MEVFVTQLLNGLINGSLYGIIAVGLTLTFGITGVVNFAFGEFMMIGAYMTWYFGSKLGIPYAAAVVMAAIFTGICGAIADQTLFRFTRNNLINGLIVSVGLTLIIQAIVLSIWTATPQQLDFVISGMVSFGGVASRPCGWSCSLFSSSSSRVHTSRYPEHGRDALPMRLHRTLKPQS